MAQTGSARKVAPRTAVTLKVTLRGSKPPIWRRLVMPGRASLADLHEAIQASMGWDGYHMHAFDVGGRQYGERGMLENSADERRATLDSLARAGHRRFRYVYDFGDDWEHLVAVEKVGTVEEGVPVPACVAGRRACPPEDCGGVGGYYALLDALADPSRLDQAEERAWVPEHFDPEAFDVVLADAAVKARVG